MIFSNKACVFDFEGYEILLFKNLISVKESYKIYNKLLNTIEWRQDSLNFGGKKVLIPRLQAWYGDPDASYKYSGLKLHPKPWTKTLLEIKELVEFHAIHKFNSVLINYYRNGKDSMSWHSDNERELGQNPLIASISFGQTRKFSLKHNEDKSKKLDMCLDNGSLLIMPKGLQEICKHQLPKQPNLTSGRINLTFRMVMQ